MFKSCKQVGSSSEKRGIVSAIAHIGCPIPNRTKRRTGGSQEAKVKKPRLTALLVGGFLCSLPLFLRPPASLASCTYPLTSLLEIVPRHD